MYAEQAIVGQAHIETHVNTTIMCLMGTAFLACASFVWLAEAEIDIRMREDFSKVCFETLLQFSFSNKATTPQEGYISRMALSVLLQRAQDVLRRYVEDERLSGRCPLPR